MLNERGAWNTLGLVGWFSETVGAQVAGIPWLPAFLEVAVVVGTPPMLAALVLAFFSSMTPYGTGPAPVLFGAGYVDTATWWKVSFITSLVNIVIWLGVGGLWWKVSGLW